MIFWFKVKEMRLMEFDSLLKKKKPVKYNRPQDYCECFQVPMILTSCLCNIFQNVFFFRSLQTFVGNAISNLI